MQQGTLARYGVEEKWCDIECVPIIEIPDSEYGAMAAKHLCEKLKITSHKDKDKLAAAKKEVYLKGFYQGVLTIGPHKGKLVQKAKLLVRQDMIAANQAAKYFEPEGEVISRDGDQCIVAFVDQWYLTYENEEWTKRVMKHAEKNFEMSRRAAADRAEMLANTAIRARIFAGSIQTPHGLTNF